MYLQTIVSIVSSSRDVIRTQSITYYCRHTQRTYIRGLLISRVYLKTVVYTLSSSRNTRHIIRICNLLFTCCYRRMQGACVKGMMTSSVAVLFILGGWFTVVQQEMRVAIKVV